MNTNPEFKEQITNLVSLSAVVAVARNGVIGRENTLPWRLKSDLQRFKKLTMGHTLIMGRKTYESIGRPLPGRVTIVLSRTSGFCPPGVLVVGTLDQAISSVPAGQKAFVVGGAEIYRQVKPLIQDLYITRVEADIEGDASLDPWNLDEFECIEEIHTPSDADNEWPTTYQHYRRVVANA